MAIYCVYGYNTTDGSGKLDKLTEEVEKEFDDLEGADEFFEMNRDKYEYLQVERVENEDVEVLYWSV